MLCVRFINYNLCVLKGRENSMAVAWTRAQRGHIFSDDFVVENSTQCLLFKICILKFSF